MKRLLLTALAGTLLTTAATTAFADTPEERAIDYRKAVFTVIGYNFGPMGAMVRGDAPFDAEVFARNAANVAAVSHMAIDGFIPNSDLGETRSKPEIWTNWDDFSHMMVKMEEEVTRLAEVAQGASSVNDVRRQFGATANSCRDCHDAYRTQR